MKKILLLLWISIHGISAWSQFQNPSPSTIYDDSDIARVNISIDEEDLNLLLTPGNEQNNEEFPATFEWRSNLRTELEENVGFRLRGNTSRYAAKKSFKISINSFEKGRDLDGFEKLNLNGEHNDPCIIRSKICWDLMNAQGIPSSRSNHVELYINDTYYGLYANIEHIDEEFIELRFGNKAGNLYKCLYPADLTYHGEDADYYKREENGRRAYELKTNEELDDYSGLVNFIKILNETPAPSFEQEINKVFDVSSYLHALAIETLTGHWDNYGVNQNNYYLYHNPDDNKFYYIPYDMDNTLGVDWFDQDWAEWNIYKWYTDSRPLTKRILAVSNFRNQYSAIIKDLLENDFHPDQLLPRIDQLKSLIQDAAERDSLRTYDYGWSTDDFNKSFAEALDDFHVRYGLKAYITRRRETALQQLESFILREPKIVQNISIYPNPTHSTFSIDIPQNTIGSIAEIYTITGQKVLEVDCNSQSTKVQKQLAPGSYLIRIVTSEDVSLKKLIIQ